MPDSYLLSACLVGSEMCIRDSTDSELSPLVAHANHVLLARCRALSYVDSFTAPIALIGAIATALSLRTEHTERLEELEALWKRYQVFY